MWGCAQESASRWVAAEVRRLRRELDSLRQQVRLANEVQRPVRDGEAHADDLVASVLAVDAQTLPPVLADVQRRFLASGAALGEASAQAATLDDAQDEVAKLQARAAALCQALEQQRQELGAAQEEVARLRASLCAARSQPPAQTRDSAPFSADPLSADPAPVSPGGEMVFTAGQVSWALSEVAMQTSAGCAELTRQVLRGLGQAFEHDRSRLNMASCAADVLDERRVWEHDLVSERIGLPREAAAHVPAALLAALSEATVTLPGDRSEVEAVRAEDVYEKEAYCRGSQDGHVGRATMDVLVCDMGGGIFDVSLLAIEGGDFETQAMAGSAQLGGECFDDRIVEWCMQDFRRRNHGKDIAGSLRAVRCLRAQCERARRALASATHATIEIDSLIDCVGYSCSLSRVRFVELSTGPFRNLVGPVGESIRNSGIDERNVHEVVLVRGVALAPRRVEPHACVSPGDRRTPVAHCSKEHFGQAGRAALRIQAAQRGRSTREALAQQMQGLDKEASGERSAAAAPALAQAAPAEDLAATAQALVAEGTMEHDGSCTAEFPIGCEAKIDSDALLCACAPATGGPPAVASAPQSKTSASSPATSAKTVDSVVGGSCGGASSLGDLSVAAKSALDSGDGDDDYRVTLSDALCDQAAGVPFAWCLYVDGPTLISMARTSAGARQQTYLLADLLVEARWLALLAEEFPDIAGSAPSLGQ